MVQFNGRVSMSVTGGEFPGNRTLPAGQTWFAVPTHFQHKPDGTELRSHKLKRRYRQDLPVPNLRVSRECYNSSMAFVFSTACYLTELGDWYGLPIYGDREDDDGSNFSQYAVTKLDTHAQIDGRLFEWDRDIRFVGRK